MALIPVALFFCSIFLEDISPLCGITAARFELLVTSALVFKVSLNPLHCHSLGSPEYELWLNTPRSYYLNVVTFRVRSHLTTTMYFSVMCEQLHW